MQKAIMQRSNQRQLPVDIRSKQKHNGKIIDQYKKRLSIS